ncbi:hypothetical protein [Pseudonocardia acidicola]|uniref:Uncharacterized protein n=1 Tax=Pseudonocardia acidicola TaxID=2724939 RepID=A0ABX1S8S2_9PSEU|nr:hypothetical protein [Pseudonocardia acidicola]NMH97304.1 hypothetical protein [Pseudonocardia acidicola]
MTTLNPARTPALPLFDPAAGERPPRDAVELYLETPVTLGVLHQAATEGGHREIVTAAEQAREAAVAAALASLRREGSHLKVGPHYRRPGGGTVGLFLPGRLYITRITHLWVEGWDDVPRLHDHIYIGAQGIADEDGQHWPTDFYSLRTQVVSILNAEHRGALHRSLMESIGAVWSIPAYGQMELVEPPLEQYVDDYPRVFCPSSSVSRWIVQDMVLPPGVER